MKKILILATLLLSSYAMANTYDTYNSNNTYIGIDLDKYGVYVGYTPWQHLSLEVGAEKVKYKEKITTYTTEEVSKLDLSTKDIIKGKGNYWFFNKENNSFNIVVEKDIPKDIKYFDTISKKYSTPKSIEMYVPTVSDKTKYSNTARASILLHSDLNHPVYVFAKYSVHKYNDYTSLGFGANLSENVSARLGYSLDSKQIGFGLIWKF